MGLSHRAEQVVRRLTRNTPPSRTVRHSLEDGQGDLRFELGRELGRGVFGAVYEVRLSVATSSLHAARQQHPSLFDGDSPRQDLVIKVPHRVTGLPNVVSPFVRALRQEVAQTREIAELTHGRVHSAELLLVHEGERPFLIKRRLCSIPVGELPVGPDGFAPEVEEALRTDIFEPVRQLQLQTQGRASVDIRAPNVFVDPETGRAELVEATYLKPGLHGLFTRSGFDGYVRYLRDVAKDEHSHT